ncbi:hypothetical protein [Streptomyces sp. AC555_RSS877]|uniref:hypothetical protein n=1 Tax=Streptomyces sp. AC555_RSS877 TaxID=2823688 RepID=UPI001C27F081|nr:hypothetical protein [Streptomyces sp. AC555_RSS877]
MGDHFGTAVSRSPYGVSCSDVWGELRRRSGVRCFDRSGVRCSDRSGVRCSDVRLLSWR